MSNIKITIEAQLDDEELKPKHPIFKIMKILSKEDTQVKWYAENRERILANDKERRSVYNREKYKERQARKKALVHEIMTGNQVVMPDFPADNVLRFDNL